MINDIIKYTKLQVVKYMSSTIVLLQIYHIKHLGLSRLMYEKYIIIVGIWEVSWI